MTGNADRRTRRIAHAASVGLVVTAWECLPDYVDSKTARFWIKTALLGVGVTTAVALAPEPLFEAENPLVEEDPTPADAHHELAGKASALADPRVAALAAVGMVAAMFGVNQAERRGRERLVGYLTSRGCARPHTRVALAMGALAAVSTYVEPPSSH